jgi:hypothetical protein
MIKKKNIQNIQEIPKQSREGNKAFTFNLLSDVEKRQKSNMTQDECCKAKR